MTQVTLDSFKAIVESLKKEDSKNSKGSEDAKQALIQIRDLLITQGYDLK